jgi:hypothetical protein
MPSKEGTQTTAAKTFSASLSLEYFNPTTMGATDIKKKKLDVPSDAQVINLGFAFERTRFRTFKARLDRADGTSSWPVPGNFAGRSVGSQQTVRIKISATGLSGDYWLSINGVGPAGYSETVGSYYLVIVRH